MTKNGTCNHETLYHMTITDIRKMMNLMLLINTYAREV